jgi:hypothetical protein
MDQEAYQKLRERVVYFLKLLKTIKSKRVTRWSVEDLRNAVKWAKLIEKQLETIPSQVVDEILSQENAEVSTRTFQHTRKLLWGSLLENPTVAEHLLDSMYSVSEELGETEDSFLQVLADHVSKSSFYETCYWTTQKDPFANSSFYFLSLVDLLCSNESSDVSYRSFFGTSPVPDTVIGSHFTSGFYQSLAQGESALVQEQHYFRKHGALLLDQKWKEKATVDDSLLHLFLCILLVVHENRSEDENSASHCFCSEAESIQFYRALEHHLQSYVSDIFSQVDCLEQNPILCSRVAQYYSWFADLLIPYLFNCLEDTLKKCKLSIDQQSEWSFLATVIQRVVTMLQLVVTKRCCFDIVVHKLRFLVVDIPDIQSILKKCIDWQQVVE